MTTKPLKEDWRELTQFLIRKYLYIDPMDMKQWKNTAKVYGENCVVCGKPLIPNKFSNGLEKKLLKHIEELLSQSKSQIVEQIENKIIAWTDKQHKLPEGSTIAFGLGYQLCLRELRLQIKEEILKIK